MADDGRTRRRGPRGRWVAWLLALGGIGACAPSSPSPWRPLPPPPSTAGAVSWASGLARSAIESTADFEAMAYRDGGLLTPGRVLKFLIDNRDPARPRVAFMNSNYRDADGTKPDAARFHRHFGARVLPDFDETRASFTAATYDTHDKRYIAGAIQTYFVDGATEPLYGIQFWPEDVIRGDAIVRAVRIVRTQFRIGDANLAFVATGSQQVIGEAASDLEALGVAARTLDEVLGAVDFIPLNRGEAWGFLRMYPADPEALSVLDIPVFRQLPLDLTVVAGTITKAYQDPTSHVNLKSKERGTPNMVLRSAGPDHPRLAPFVDRPIHLVVEVEGYRVAAATEAEVRARLDDRRRRPWRALPYEPTRELAASADMCPQRAATCLELTARYGGKAAMLGFLTSATVLGRTTDAGSMSAKMGYDLVPRGFAVPFSSYRDFVAHPPNADLREALDTLIDREKRGVLESKARRALAEDVRRAFHRAAFPPGMVAGVAARAREVLPGVKKIKVRSSANAEDQPQFDGAGLYQSFSANLDKPEPTDDVCRAAKDGVKLKMKPKTLGCAIKGVFASLWNKRAIEERSFARLDHADAVMGLAIVPKYDLEAPIAANSVVVTRVMNSRNVYGYTFATQVGNGLVTNPAPGTLAETIIAAFTMPREAASFVVTRHATPVADRPPRARPVMDEPHLRQLLAITRHAEEQYCEAREDYYPHDCRYAPADPDKARALDFELKLLENGRFICKQMREFSGR
ncbi:MAG: PEP/pyruvate-binding domain-containing protein [Myxococcota bacterium]